MIRHAPAASALCVAVVITPLWRLAVTTPSLS
jgi:hypothetical protein